MADMDDLQEGARYGVGVPVAGQAGTIKGMSGHDWGIRSRMARIMNPETSKTVMLAFDHGYFQGPTAGLERLDLSIAPLVPQADAIMLTRGALRSTIAPESKAAVVLRASGGPSILGDLSQEHVAMAIDDAIRLDAAALAVQVFIGSENESASVKNMTDLVDAGQRNGIPTLAVTAVGRDMVRDARYFRLATRMSAELGAHIVKTYYVEEGFATVTSSCPVPVIIAGGRRTDERTALEMAYRAIDEGAAGVDMGRNIFQSEHPAAMIAAVRAVVHDGMTADDAYTLFQDTAADA